MEIPTMRGGGRLIEHTFIERALDDKFSLMSTRAALRTHPSKRTQVTALLRHEGHRMMLSERIQQAWGEDRVSALFVAMLRSIDSDMRSIQNLHAKLIDDGLRAPELDLEHARTLLDRRLLGTKYIGGVIDTVSGFMDEAIKVDLAGQYLAAVRLRWQADQPAYALLALGDALTEVLISYFNLLIMLHPPPLERIVELVGSTVDGLGELTEWLDGRSLHGAVLHEVTRISSPVTPLAIRHMTCTMSESATLFAATVLASVAVTAAAQLGLDGVRQTMHDALASVLGVRRLQYPGDDVPVSRHLKERDEVDQGAREARYRDEFLYWTPEKTQRVLIAALHPTKQQSRVLEGLMHADSPLRRLVTARLIAAADKAISRGECCRAPPSAIIAGPWCRSVNRLCGLVKIYELVLKM